MCRAFVGLGCIIQNWAELAWASREAGPILLAVKHTKKSPLYCVPRTAQSCSLGRKGVKPAVLCRRSPRIAEHWMGAAAAAAGSVGSTGAIADSYQKICYSQILAIMMLKVAELSEMPSREGLLLHICIFFALITQQNK